MPSPVPTPEARPSDPIESTATATPVAYDIENWATRSKFLESQYAAFGNRWSQQPLTDQSSNPPFVNGHPLAFDTSTGSAVPSLYAPLVTQAIYSDDLWNPGDQFEDFASRTQHLAGSHSSSILNLESGLNLTRTTDYKSAKYAIGETHSGVAIRGGTWDINDDEYQDRWHVLGSVSLGIAALSDHQDSEGETDQERRVNILQVTGSENAAYVGRRFADAPNLNSADGPYDARSQEPQESDLWDLVPADIQAMLGTSAVIFLDNKRGDYCSLHPPDEPVSGGYVSFASAFRFFVASVVKDSWVNVGEARGFQGGLTLLGSAFDSSANWFDGFPRSSSERDGSVVRNWVGFDLLPIPTPDCSQIELRSSKGFTIFDQIPGTGGGAPPMHPDYPDLYVERYSSIIRGDVVVGDSQSPSNDKTGYNTDVVHVRDVVHLHPRVCAPYIDPDLPDEEKVGLLYFDSRDNTLRVSVGMGVWEPANRNAMSDEPNPQEGEVAWVKVMLDYDSINPEVDIAGSECHQGCGSLDKSGITVEEVKARIEQARIQAAEGTSTFQAAMISPVGEVFIDGGGTGYAEVTITYSGFGGAKVPSFRWRKQAPSERYAEDSTEWQEVPAEFVVPVKGLEPIGGGALTIYVPWAVGNNQIEARDVEGFILQLMASEEKTRKIAATSIAVRESNVQELFLAESMVKK